MCLITWSSNKKKYSNNISIKKGLTSNTDNKNNRTCLNLKRFHEAKDILLQVIRLLSLQYKRQDRAGNNSVSLMWRHAVCEENNCDLKISFIKIYWTVVIVYGEEV